jgi:hypothetical protein
MERDEPRQGCLLHYVKKTSNCQYMSPSGLSLQHSPQLFASILFWATLQPGRHDILQSVESCSGQRRSLQRRQASIYLGDAARAHVCLFSFKVSL